MTDIFAPSLRSGTVTVVLDVTGSMDRALSAMSRYLAMYVINRCAAQVDPPIDRLGFVTFHDHENTNNYPELFKAKTTPKVWGLTGNLEEFGYWLQAAQFPENRGDGGDAPEAVACAIESARAIDPWASIWLVTDAAPHGVGYPNEPGCSCGIPLRLNDVNALILRGGDMWPDLPAIYRARGARVVAVDPYDLEGLLSAPPAPLALAR